MHNNNFEPLNEGCSFRPQQPPKLEERGGNQRPSQPPRAPQEPSGANNTVSGNG